MAEAQELTRRDFLFVASGAFAAVGTAFAAWPFIHQMSPAANVRALSTTEVDLSPIEPGQIVTVLWQGKPVFIRHRTEAEIAEARAVAVDALIDKDARNANLGEAAPARDDNRVINPNWLVVVGVCTHLGCVPLGHQGPYDGWLCPCHGSLYDTSGRVRKGPAPENLPVPPYRFTSDTMILIG